MCQGVPILANNKKAVYGKKTNSHSTTAQQLKLKEDEWRKFEWLWWEKKLQQVHYDRVAEDILNKIDLNKSTLLAENLVKNNFNTQDKLVKWLKDVPDEWDKLLQPEFKSLAKKVNPKLLLYQDKIAKFKKTPIERYNPYQATKLPSIKEIKGKIPRQIWGQIGGQIGDQIRDQIWDQIWGQIWGQIRDQIWDQIGGQIRGQIGDQIWGQIGGQIWDQIWGQIRGQIWGQIRDQIGGQIRGQIGGQIGGQIWDQIYATSYWGIKVSLGLHIHHWFFDFLKLGITIIFVKGKVKVFGKKGMYLGEYDEKEFK